MSIIAAESWQPLCRVCFTTRTRAASFCQEDYKSMTGDETRANNVNVLKIKISGSLLIPLWWISTWFIYMTINLKGTRTFCFILSMKSIKSKGPFVNLASNMILFFNPHDDGFPSAQSWGGQLWKLAEMTAIYCRNNTCLSDATAV